MRGDAETLKRYFPELSHPDFKSAITLGHGRYSTNTDSRAERAQMFSTLGHNGEINSIDRLGREAVSLGFQLPERASDSQVLDRVVESFMFDYDLSLMNALEIAFPPVWSEIARFPAELRELYRYWRRAFGALAQGPAAIIARQADEIVFSSDALGLRPLWCGETEKEFFASSEKGVVPLEQMVRDPRPLAPGEKMGFLLERGEGVRVFEYHELQRRALEDVRKRIPLARLNDITHWFDEAEAGGRGPGAGAKTVALRRTERRTTMSSLHGSPFPRPPASDHRPPTSGGSSRSAGTGSTRWTSRRWRRRARSRSADSAGTARSPRSRSSARTSPTSSTSASRW